MNLLINILFNKQNFQIEYNLDNSNAAKSVVYLANLGKYDGLEIRRVVKGFVIQAVYEEEKLDKYFNYDIPLHANKINTYDLCMAGDKKISSGSCWFISLSEETNKKLSYNFESIGKLVSGEDIIKKIENVDVKDIKISIPGVTIREPLEPIIITSIRSDTNIELSDLEIIGGQDVLK